jgi:hypothetical protein
MIMIKEIERTFLKFLCLMNLQRKYATARKREKDIIYKNLSAIMLQVETMFTTGVKVIRKNKIE